MHDQQVIGDGQRLGMFTASEPVAHLQQRQIAFVLVLGEVLLPLLQFLTGALPFFAPQERFARTAMSPAPGIALDGVIRKFSHGSGLQISRSPFPTVARASLPITEHTVVTAASERRCFRQKLFGGCQDSARGCWVEQVIQQDVCRFDGAVGSPRLVLDLLIGSRPQVRRGFRIVKLLAQHRTDKLSQQPAALIRMLGRGRRESRRGGLCRVNKIIRQHVRSY